MKKIFSLILAALMTLSVMLLPASAETGSAGNWEMHLDAFEESKLQSGGNVYLSTPGYKYTEDGFEVVPPVYSGVQAKYTVISKEKLSTKDFSVKIRIDEFDLSGDAWLSFTFWSEKNGLVQGSGTADYGYGWTSLVKDCADGGTRDGKLSYVEGYSQGTQQQPGGFQKLSNMDFTPKNADGEQIVEFKVENHYIYINGEQISSTDAQNLRNTFRNDSFSAYFGITVKSGMAGLPVKFTILEVNGEKPTGSDSASPVNRQKTYGAMIDASEIPAKTPGVLFDASLEAQNSSRPSVANGTASITDNGTIKINASITNGFFTFSVNDDYTVDIKDFPYIAIVLKDFCTCGREDGLTIAENCYFRESNFIYYCAGNVVTADSDHRFVANRENMVDITPEENDDYYVLVYAKVDTEEFNGSESRIHSLRFDFTNMQPNNNISSFEIEFAGFFRSVSDMIGYVTDEGYALVDEEISYTDPKDPTGDPTEKPSEESSSEPTEEPSSEPTEEPSSEPTEEPSDEITEAPTSAVTEDNTTAAGNGASDDNGDSKGGCRSAAGFGAIAMITTVSVAGLVTFKKKKKS